MYKIYCELRDQKGYKDSDVAHMTGITKSTFSDWKNGRSKPKNDKLKKIADCFGVPLDYLMTGEKRSSSVETTITAKDERDIKKDLDSIMEKLSKQEYGPAAYDGKEIPEDDQELFAGQLELMLRRLKIINKEKYNPNKNKK